MLASQHCDLQRDQMTQGREVHAELSVQKNTKTSVVHLLPPQQGCLGQHFCFREGCGDKFSGQIVVWGGGAGQDNGQNLLSQGKKNVNQLCFLSLLAGQSSVEKISGKDQRWNLSLPSLPAGV